MTDRLRLYAESEFSDYRDRERQRDAQRTGILGNQAGTIAVSGRTGFVYVRLDADPRKTVMALNRNGIQLVADLPVAVRREWVEGAPKWVLDGRAQTPLYPTDPLVNTVGSHASQHLRGNLGTGGFDALEVYNRMLVQTRIQAQATPNMTVYLTPGPFMANGAWYLSGGGSSGAFSVPTDYRCDLVYIASDLSMTILQGVDGASPATRPSVPSNAFPLAWVWLDSTVTAITEAMIEDARLIAGQTFSMAAAGHDVLSATHTDSDPAAVVEDDLIVGTYSPAVFSPVWERLPKGGDGDVLTINSTTHHVAWMSPQSAGGAPTGAAGGDLGGTYPNPSVVDDSHTHTAATLPATMPPEDHAHNGVDGTSKLAQANTHESPDTDAATSSLHHTIGAGATNAAAGNHTHAGTGKYRQFVFEVHDSDFYFVNGSDGHPVLALQNLE